MRFACLVGAICLCAACHAQELAYQKPSPAITAVMETPRTPAIDVNPTGDYALVVERERYRSISDLAAPMIPLAGIRINPNNDGPSRPLPISSLKLLRISDGSTRSIGLVPGGKAIATEWSPDGKRFAVLFAFPDRVQVAVADATGGRLRLLHPSLSAAYGEPYQWMPDSKTLLVREVPANRGTAPVRPDSPTGPEVQESLGSKTPARTLPDALKDSLGERQFDYYMSCQLALVDASSGRSSALLFPGILEASPSPDGRKLLVEQVDRPYSRKLYAGGFPRTFSILDLRTKKLTPVCKQASEEGAPLDGVVTGPREIRWRPDVPETLLWVEALDGGDPKSKVEYRDRVMLDDLSATAPTEMIRLKERFEGIEWTAAGDRAILTQYDYDQERLTRFLLALIGGSAHATVLGEYDTRERYRYPGNFITKELPSGKSVLLQDGDSVYLSGLGAGPTGDHPFLDRLDLSTRKTERVWRCDDDHYEWVVSVLGTAGPRFLTVRESPTEYPNYVLHDGSSMRAITEYRNPHPELLGITKRLIKYKRADGVSLSFTLYLPPGTPPGTKLPAVVEAYPLEFNDADTAGQVSGSTKTFPILGGDLLFLLAGYAVMDSVAMPIVGSPRTVNDKFVEQLTADAAAAVRAADETGSVDTSRLAVMGHSYGAFMTANLIAHTDLFKAGAAESGAYNRSLTPFGFQSERRTFWEAPQMYLSVSPFAFADKIKHPLLLIHGLQDDNPGTYTIQSERMFQAISGNGGTTRLVLLPYEAHGYASKESIEHVFWEELSWFDKYVKGG